jgi:Lon protease-like protein
MKPKRIPLFPLQVVLFPGIELPLHIFEPRYKLMIRHCVDDKLEFGVVLAREEGVASVGCTAEVVRVVRTFPDGKMDIVTEGRTAYQVLKLVEEKPYYEADVDYLDEEEAPEAVAPPAEKLLELYDQCHRLLFGSAPDPIEKDPGASLAFQIASDLPVELSYRQELLEIRRESERRNYLFLRLGEWLPQLEHMQEMRRRAGGNGQGLV